MTTLSVGPHAGSGHPESGIPISDWDLLLPGMTILTLESARSTGETHMVSPQSALPGRRVSYDLDWQKTRPHALRSHDSASNSFDEEKQAVGFFNRRQPHSCTTHL